MFSKNMFNPESFYNIEENEKIVGFEFQFKIQYYRGVTLSIVRDIAVEIDGKSFEREHILFYIEGELFTQEEMQTVIDYRWKFGQWATIKVLCEGGLRQGKHHIKATQTIAPSYMPMILVESGECDFEIR